MAKQATIFEMARRQKVHEERREQFMQEGQISKDMLYGPGRQRRLTEMQLTSKAALTTDPSEATALTPSQLLLAVQAAMQVLQQALTKPGEGVAGIIAALDSLDQLPLDLPLLMSTKVGRLVQAVCKCTATDGEAKAEFNASVRPRARALRQKWKLMVQQLPTKAAATQISSAAAQQPKRCAEPYVPAEQSGHTKKKPKLKPTRYDSSTTAAAEGDESSEMWFGRIASTVVGIQYYNGVVSDGESVLLEREPHNKHDKNAIVVLNMDGTQVGHISRHDAAQLCTLIDRERDPIRIEGTIPSGSANVYKMPIDIELFGRQEDTRKVHASMTRFDKPIRNSQPNTAPVTRPIYQPAAKGQQRRSGVDTKPKSAVVAMSAETIIERELDNVYQNGSSFEDMQALSGPPSLDTTLYLHQQKALYWMVDREDNLDIAQLLQQNQSASKAASVFFWKRTRSGLYFNSATNFATKKAPSLAAGGILADDMLLGTVLVMCYAVHRRCSMLSVPACIMCAISQYATQGAWEDCHLAGTHLNTDWAEHIEALCPVGFQCYTYHGTKRRKERAFLEKHAVVLTTYATLAADYKLHKSGGGESMFGITWARVMLDEAHQIKNAKSLQSHSCCALRAKTRWCLTGTPIQNKLDDLYGLVKFLQLKPLCDGEWWTRLVTRPIKYCNPAAFERLQVVLQTFCLRRTKSQKVTAADGSRRSLLTLPAITQTVMRVQLSDLERQRYDEMFARGRSVFEKLCANGAVMSKYSIILELLLRLRQLCCHTSLVSKAQLATDHSKPLERAEIVQRVVEMLKADTLEDDCAICLEPIRASSCIITPCAHVFCASCVEASLRVNPLCPLCRNPVQPSDLIDPPAPSNTQIESTSSASSSSKVSALVDCLIERQEKSLVFSQFSSFLDLIENQLKQNGIQYVRLDGTRSVAQRRVAVHQFQEEEQYMVFLISLKAGGTGLNLTAASCVYIVDPWWNPSTEDQAIDRCHRIGQNRDVRVIRIVAANSIEEKILELQNKKRSLTKSAFSNAPKTLKEMERMNDLKLIFDS